MVELDESLLDSSEPHRNGLLHTTVNEREKDLVPLPDDDLRRTASMRQKGHAPAPIVTKILWFMTFGIVLFGLLAWNVLQRGWWSVLSNHPLGLEDYPIPEFITVKASLESYRNNHPRPDETASQEILELVDEYTTCLNAIISEVQTPEVSPFIRDAKIIAKHIHHSNYDELSGSCHPQYHIGTRKLLETVYENCPSFKYGEQPPYGQTVYEDKLRSIIPWTAGTDSSLTYLFGPNGVIENYEAFCNKEDPGLGTDVCTELFRAWGLEHRLLSLGRMGFEIKELIRKTRNPLVDWPKSARAFAERNDRIAQDCQGKLRPRQDQTNSLFENVNFNWRKKPRGPRDNWRVKEILKEGVCSGCIWRRFVWREGMGEVYMPDAMEEDEAMEWIKTVHLIKDVCGMRGKRLEPGNLRRLDEKWIE
jgi:hypothetical protein